MKENKKSKFGIVFITLIILLIGLFFLVIGLKRIMYNLLVSGTIFLYIGLGFMVFTLVMHKILIERYRTEIKLN